MQLKNIKLLLCIIFVFVGLSSQAQRIKSFSNDTDVYIEELRRYYKDDKNIDKDQQKQYELLLTEYIDVWNQFDRDEQSKMIDISNKMLGLRIRPLPGFYDFLKVQVDFKKSTQTEESFNQWLLGLDLVLKSKKTKEFTDLIATTSLLINGNCLYESRTTKWTSSSNDFTFKTDGMLMVLFEDPMELTCSSKLDSNYIVGTKGIYYPTDQKWKGKGGKVYWSRNDLPDNKCWAELSNYEANTKFSKFTADSVVFVNTDYFKKPLLGRLEEDLGLPTTPEKYTYPRFKSYQKDFTVKNIFPDIDYSGGFTMNGAKFLASGGDKENVTLTIHRNGKPFIVVEAKTFFVNSERITSESVTATVYMGEDSIFNAGLQFKYIHSSKEVTLLNDAKRNYSSPFENTYHKLDMYCEAIYWKIGSEDLDFSTTRAFGAASFAQFESRNYYSEARYSAIKGIDNLSPLERVKNYCNRNKTRFFYIDEFTAYIKMDPIQAKSMLHELARYGFLNVNNQDEYVYVKQKLFDFSRSESKAVDYDAINLSSALTDGSANATLSLKNNDLKLRGVERFVLSDTQNVVITPTNKELIVKKDRDLAFDGRILAGRFDMAAKECYFTYNQFKIDLQKIDSLQFYVTSFTDNKKLAKVKTPLQNLRAELLIDKNDNKASLKKLEDYPILNSLDYSYAYYEEPYIQEGVYKKEKFYYKLNPFTIKRLFKFETDSLVFAGVLNSANIFPDINEPLKVQPDYSLGFVMKTSQNGLPVYGGKGQYYQTIDLSYKGLLGQGKVTYLASETRSENIVFMPDSMHAITDTFFVKEQYAGGGKTEFPDVKVGKAIERWYPYENKMYVFQDKAPFQMYKNEVLLHGHLLLTPVGMTGAGTSKIDLADIVADKFDFKQTNFRSDTSEFKLKGTNYDGLAFYSKNVKSKIDLKTRKGEFLSNEELTRVTLPILQYAAYIDKFTWEMDKAELAFANSKSESSTTIEKLEKKNLLSATIPGALYVSTNSMQDSLHFNATKANFKYKENVLNSDQVFIIKVADAAIFPNARKVAIRPAAKIDELAKAVIIADTTHKYHQFYDANTQINGRKSYSATGYIDYIDENKAKQKLFLSAIEPNTARVTIAKGSITDSSKFMLSPVFAFKGEIAIDAQQPNYTFNGGVQLKYKCAAEEELAWMRFNSTIIPDSIYIPVQDVPTDFSGGRTTASILYHKQGMQPYAAFLTKDKAVDNEIISASGYLTFNKKKAEYQIGSLQKLANPQENRGNYLTFNQISCDMKGEGRFDFGFKQDQVKVLTYGLLKVNNKKEETESDIAVALEFPFAKKAMDFMAANISEDLSVEMVDLTNNPKILQLFKEYINNESRYEKVQDELLSMGDLKRFPDELNYGILLTGVKLKYNPDPRIGYTYSGAANLIKAGDKQQYKRVRTGIQVRRYRTEVTLNVYIEISSDHWYFFSYEESSRTKKTKMRAYSSLGEFNDMLKEVKPEDRLVENKSTKSSYDYALAVPRQKDNFIRTIQGLDTEEEPEEVEESSEDPTNNDNQEEQSTEEEEVEVE